MLFSNDDDVSYIVNKLIEETRETNRSMGKSFDIAKSTLAQIGFFACSNFFLKKEHQEDIAKHLYCLEYSVPPYPGVYGEQPLLWILKSQIIKNALIKRDNIAQQRAMDKTKAK